MYICRRLYTLYRLYLIALGAYKTWYNLFPEVVQVVQAGDKAMDKLIIAIEQWDAIYDKASELDRARFDLLRTLGGLLPATDFGPMYDQAHAAGDSLSVLLKAKEACDAVADQCMT